MVDMDVQKIGPNGVYGVYGVYDWGIQKRDYAMGGIGVRVMNLSCWCEHILFNLSKLSVIVPPIRTARLFPRGIGITSGYGLPDSVCDIKHRDMDCHASFGNCSCSRYGCDIDCGCCI
jgi:hypothetical protein